MVTIRLLGEAGRRFGRSFVLDVKNAAEAVRALCVQMPAMRQYLIESGDNGILWRVVTEDPMGVDEEGLFAPCSKRVVLAPQPAGRGSCGAHYLLGVALVSRGLHHQWLLLLAPLGWYCPTSHANLHPMSWFTFAKAISIWCLCFMVSG
jgi:predicted phage tail protein